MTSKQRSALRAMASEIEVIGQIGKGGVTESVVESVKKALDARELIKLSVLKNADDTPEYYAGELAAALDAEIVCVIGKKIVLYRVSEKKGVKHILEG